MSSEPRDHYVYRAYDEHGVLLYVGCTKHPSVRVRAHIRGDMYGSGWFGPFVNSWYLTGPLPRDVALALEDAEITAREPVFNGKSRGNCIPKLGTRALVSNYFASRGLPSPVGATA